MEVPAFDSNAAFPPLRPAAKVIPSQDQDQQPVPSGSNEPATAAPGDIVPPRQIEEHEVEMYKEQDRYLPIANVGRIMKKCLPETTKVSKDAKECVQECTSEFISFITSEAAERCQLEKRKTINGEDILFALQQLGFDEYGVVMQVYLAKYREHLRSTGKRAQKRAAKEAALAAQPQPQTTGETASKDGEGQEAGEYDEEEGEEYPNSVEGEQE
ncbi:nuclear transcription factor Y subunit beta [Sporobolomyces salmoneus]|uniref:nuclear transcription factor Y subunit beta n=1 Tax=Sporobolomyces salmoneus TaxID=183962 RepID=UPI00316EE4D2